MVYVRRHDLWSPSGYHTARSSVPCRCGLLSNAPKSNLKDDRVVVTRRLSYRKREDVAASRYDFYRVLVSAREGECRTMESALCTTRTDTERRCRDATRGYGRTAPVCE